MFVLGTPTSADENKKDEGNCIRVLEITKTQLTHCCVYVTIAILLSWKYQMPDFQALCKQKSVTLSSMFTAECGHPRNRV